MPTRDEGLEYLSPSAAACAAARIRLATVRPVFIPSTSASGPRSAGGGPPSVARFRSEMLVAIERGQVRFILDAKWKRLEPGTRNHGVSQADAYQLFAYGRTYGCRRVVLVYPRTERFRETPNFRFVGDRDLELDCFPVDVPDAAGSVREMVRTLTRRQASGRRKVAQ